MRLGSNSISQNRPISKQTIQPGIIQNQFKKFNPLVSDNFNIIGPWSPTRGTWVTDGTNLSTSTAATSYPILTSYDLRSQNITATMSLISSGVGVVFWLQDENNWWAGVTFYVQSSESYTTGTFSCNCRDTCHWAVYCAIPPSCQGVCCTASGQNCRALGGGVVCDTCYSTGTRTRYNFFIRILRSVDGSVTQESILNLRSTASDSTQWSPATVSSADNINGIQLSTLGNVITLRGRDDANNFYSSSISYTASNPNRGLRSGIIFTPGSNYLLNSAVQNITIVGS
jgi:hypothetical protein